MEQMLELIKSMLEEMRTHRAKTGAKMKAIKARMKAI
jgi:hypothetical protein